MFLKRQEWIKRCLKGCTRIEIQASKVSTLCLAGPSLLVEKGVKKKKMTPRLNLNSRTLGSVREAPWERCVMAD